MFFYNSQSLQEIQNEQGSTSVCLKFYYLPSLLRAKLDFPS